MIFYMNSKVFLKKYLESEEDWKILDSYYIIMSYRIKKKPHSGIRTIQLANNILMPNTNVMSSIGRKEFVKRYKNQLSESNAFFATIIEGSIKKGYQIVILETAAESRMKHYKILQDYVWETFGYPIYTYTKYQKGYYENLAIDEETVLKRCKEEIKNADERRRRVQGNSEYQGYIAMINEYSKKKLRKEAERLHIILGGDESKEELLELLIEDAKNRYQLNMVKRYGR